MHVRWIALALAWMPWGALAQTAPEVPADKSVLACLEKGGPKIDYPARDRQLETPGFLRVSLRFSAPDRRPEVAVLFRAASDEMVDEVRSHVRGYRLPCLPPGQTTTAVQEFEFKPRENTPVTWTDLRDTDARASSSAEDARLAACTRTPRTQPELSGPMFDRRTVNVFVELRFQAPDRAPDVAVRYASASISQVHAITDYVRQYRVPCLAVGDKPYVTQQQFTFRPQGAEVRTFKEAIRLATFLANVKGIRQTSASFDFKTMNCPFQVAWTLGKPAVDNRVGEVGAADLNRTVFLSWLAGLEMDLPPEQFEQLVGQTLLIDVPCGTLRLTPKP